MSIIMDALGLCFCTGPDKTGKCACQRSNSLETQFDQTTEALSIHKALYVEALKQNIKLEEKLKEARLYWYNQGYVDAFMEMNEEKNDREGPMDNTKIGL